MMNTLWFTLHQSFNVFFSALRFAALFLVMQATWFVFLCYIALSKGETSLSSLTDEQWQRSLTDLWFEAMTVNIHVFWVVGGFALLGVLVKAKVGLPPYPISDRLGSRTPKTLEG